MKFSKKDLTLEEGLTKEWIITNGLGGYSSSTILGINTRKYHGLLVAPLTPPARRFVILSKIDESIEIDNEKFDLYANLGVNFSSNGYKYLDEFEKDYTPIYTYKVNDITIKKIICMEHGKNTVCVLYKVYNNGKKAKLTLAPIITFRDFHTMNTNHEYNLKQTIKQNKVKIEVDGNSSTPIYMNASHGTYIEHFNDTFRNMYYIQEEKRGFYPEENLSVPGRFEIEIPENETREYTFVCSLEENIEEIDVKKIINKEIVRINELMSKTGILPRKTDITKETKQDLAKRELLRDFTMAVDNFIVYRPHFGLYTIIAGYPWFLDWGRDSLISFEGLLLKTKRYDVAKDVLLTLIKDVKFGLVPNVYSGYDNRPLYNSVDSALLLFEQVYKYLEYTSNYDFIEQQVYNKLMHIVESFLRGIDVDNANIFIDKKDFLLSSGTEDTQITWMDAKYGNHCFTPRNGKAVEINALWYNALKIMEELCLKMKEREKSYKYADLANKCKEAFEKSFYNKNKKCLYDVIGDSKVRPNQLFALSLSHPIIEPNSKVGKEIIETVESKLLNKCGLKTLAKGEKGYIATYEGDAFRRDSSYHQGVTWPWLLGLYYDAIKNSIEYEKDKRKRTELEEKLNEFKENVKKNFVKEMYKDGAIGSISEVYDSKAPQKSGGTIAQAWSVAEVFRIIDL